MTTQKKRLFEAVLLSGHMIGLGSLYDEQFGQSDSTLCNSSSSGSKTIANINVTQFLHFKVRQLTQIKGTDYQLVL